MQWILLIGNENFRMDAIRLVNHYGSISCHYEPEVNNGVHYGRYCVDYGADHIIYDDNPSIINDYDEDDIETLPHKNPTIIMMVFTDKERMMQVIRQDNFVRGIYVDRDDFSPIIPIEEFIKEPWI